MVWFWCFLGYSFLGFLLEVAFARATGGWADRKCLLVLPLCPVYGLGACGILLLPGWVTDHPARLFVCAALTATAAEYGMAVFYEEALGVSFWDYLGLPGNIQGRVCLPFSLAWGALSLPLVYWLHPALDPLWSLLPTPVSLLAALTLLADLLVSAVLLKRTEDRDCLKWYAAPPWPDR